MLDIVALEKEVQFALNEDIGAGDITAALIPESAQGHAKIISREPMVVCGKPWVDAVFAEVDKALRVEWQVNEGDTLKTPCTLAIVKGALNSILTAERTALNFLQTLSAVATKTKRYVEQLHGTPAKLLDTRKTIPGLRYAQKYAVRIGGGVNHRIGLFDAVLIKENHIKACGSIQNAVHTAKQNNKGQWIEVEVENLEEFSEALVAEPDRILLDNFTVEMLKQAVLLNQATHQTKRIILEASGGVNLSTIHNIAQTGVDYISVGDITKSVSAIDLSLLVLEEA